jgi:uncharacterized membrane protein
MATMTALRFPDVDGARRAIGIVRDLQSQHLLVLHDAAIVEWAEGKRKPRTEQMHSPAVRAP